MLALTALAGCGTRQLGTPAPVSTAPTSVAPKPAVAARPAPSPPPVAAVQPSAPSRRARNWDDYRVMAAQRMVAANQSTTYTGLVPEPLLAVPVLEVELNADGSVKRIEVMRQPSQARDTVQLAIDAVRRAAPFGDVSHLPKPWKFNEVFLFDDGRRFKPRSLDL
ncbi:hypothetical protein [Ideonella sp. A 288]|uniref:hypothetical protein n=1 Tax=Ideonella sp. A 288 TaxID=1962181 RepID=UPI001F3AC372|nr:hypothetical protein [Ideonella sp. A 288]